MENINKTHTEKLNVNQWKNTEMVIHWFKSIEQKSKCFFTQFDIIEFYPFITEKILEDVVVFTKQHMEVAEKDLRIIKHYRKSLLHDENEGGKRNNHKTALTLRWEATMALKSVNLMEFIYYHSFGTTMR